MEYVFGFSGMRSSPPSSLDRHRHWLIVSSRNGGKTFITIARLVCYSSFQRPSLAPKKSSSTLLPPLLHPIFFRFARSAGFDPHQASSMSSVRSETSGDTCLPVPLLSLVTHSRTYIGQFRSSLPLASIEARSSTASRSTRRTF